MLSAIILITSINGEGIYITAVVGSTTPSAYSAQYYSINTVDQSYRIYIFCAVNTNDLSHDILFRQP